MKNLLLKAMVLAFLFIETINVNAQNTWTQKNNFGTVRRGFISFVIGNKAFIGTGYDNNISFNDLWEYDQTNDTWSQKASFGVVGDDRYYAVGFSIGTNGYIGLGANDNNTGFNDLWEYNSTNDTWSAKTPFPGTPRNNAIGFAIGTKAYIGLGAQGNSTFFNDFYSWDQTSDTWMQLTDYPGAGKVASFGFSIGNKGYVGGGLIALGSYAKDFWEYDTTGNSWTQKADLTGEARNAAVSFVISDKAFVGTGYNTGTADLSNFFMYDQSTGQWTAKANFGGGNRRYMVAFAIGAKGYAGMGYSNANGYFKDFWEYESGIVICSPVFFSQNITINFGDSLVVGGIYIHKVQGTYIDTLVASNSCDSIVTTNLTVLTGINSTAFENTKVKICPNPMKDFATIEVENGFTSQFLMEVYDLQGRKIISLQIKNQGKLYRKNLAEGIYLLKLSDKKKIIAQAKLLVID